MSLRFSEEILLLALDDKTGKLLPLPERALDLAISGGLLMELAFANRVDTDQKDFMVISRESTGDALLDQVLALLDEDKVTIAKALSKVAAKADLWRRQLFADLIKKGVLTQEEHRFLWVLKERRYPVIDNREEEEVKSRIRSVVMDPEAIPDPRDIALICLMKACDLSSAVFTEAELEKVESRIDQLSRMDFIGQALARAINQIQEAILEVIAYTGM